MNNSEKIDEKVKRGEVYNRAYAGIFNQLDVLLTTILLNFTMVIWVDALIQEFGVLLLHSDYSRILTIQTLKIT